jgi:hypothetical protein
MRDERLEELKREERVILAWIRDVTARKQARLNQIRMELRVLCGVKPANAAVPESGVAR